MTFEAASKSTKQPIRLAKDPILDAICELRFKSAQAAAGDLMQGLLFGALRHEYPRTNALGAAQLPRAIRELQPALANAPLYELVGDGARVLGTDRTVGVAVTSPYPGWPAFKTRALAVFGATLGTGLVSEIERVSIKYINLIPSPPTVSLQDLVKAQIQVGQSAVSKGPLHLRTEFLIDGFTVILSLMANATAEREGKNIGQGVVVDIDVVSRGTTQASMPAVEDVIERAHCVEKDFFYSLITTQTLQLCEPIYDSD